MTRRRWGVRILGFCVLGGAFYLFGRRIWRPFIISIELAMSEATLDATRHCLEDV